jgi:hypothetical protein
MAAPSDEGQSFAATGPQEQSKERTAILPDFATPRQMIEQMRAVLEKRIATARARLARAGFECHVINGGFTVCRWGHARDIESLDELERFVEHACGGRP